MENKTVRLTLGMAVTVEVKTGKRRVIEYFLSPLMQVTSESLRERRVRFSESVLFRQAQYFTVACLHHHLRCNDQVGVMRRVCILSFSHFSARFAIQHLQ